MERVVILGIALTVVLGLLAVWTAHRSAHWHLTARILGRDIAIERAKRQALSMALGDLERGLRRGDARLCAQAMSAAQRVAEDDTEETITKLGFKLPERIQ